ncbi:hypothetical protein [Azonexus sp.]|uniref:hypothetical protein n=1 Tax=Azonexus sp. TaxID=1872668 RepID=UPI0027B9DC8F|nr:hypothetical protein [Azonexus sp.]
MNKKILLDIIGGLLIVLVVVVGYKLSPLLLPQSDLSIAPDPSCNVQQQACSVALPGGGSLVFSVNTQPIPLVKPFEVKVEVRGSSAKNVAIDFAGVDMEMGFNRPQLAERSAGIFIGEATLPVCVTGHMTWQATVLLETSDARIAVPFRFVTG